MNRQLLKVLQPPKSALNLNGRVERIIGTWSSMVRDHVPPVREEPDEIALLKRSSRGAITRQRVGEVVRT